ncbi:protein SENSITIVE TO UV 2 isoform X1 [Amaranthus tricolor]|uniref:protein SENSITIVE TO UV 2 isoform X1 n=1 Tax=Amaranthus tricolor TaxID=29722 RepID=UPI00258BCBF5|nr:protein SENSITIVE TO UV 2 isoform X1 [Amaranthus tricolor]
MATTEFTLDDDVYTDAFFEELMELESKITQQPPPQPPLRLPPQSVTSAPSYVFTSLKTVPTELPKSSVADNNSHSPPRLLSQPNPSFTHLSTDTRSVSSPSSEEQSEIERLKRELRTLSKKALDLEQECLELKKQKDKEHKPQFVPNKKPWTCKSEDYSWKEVSRSESANALAVPVPFRIGVEKKSTGIQTDEGDETLNPSTSGAVSTYGYLSKLQSIWFQKSSQRAHKNFVAKLLEACASEFCVLFGCSGLSVTSLRDHKSLTHAQMSGKSLVLHCVEVSKVSQLYTVLTKLADDMGLINAFLFSLHDLCGHENVQIVRSSLCILRTALYLLINISRICTLRDNVKVESCSPGSDAVQIHSSEVERAVSVCDVGGDGTFHTSSVTACKIVYIAECETFSFICHVDWLRLFISMGQIAVKLAEEHARVEAVSIMNIILMRTDPCSTREKFGESVVFEAISLLLRKEAGVSCRKEVVHLLYLLLNCPKILATFCSSCKVADSHTQSLNDDATVLAFKESHAVLRGLAECVVCPEFGVQELNLRKNAISVLSFLAPSGKCGFDIFLFHKLPERFNFLGLVLQVLVSEIDAEGSESCPAPEIFKERTLLMQEALRLLNRLASHPAYSVALFKELTSSRDLISMAIDIATRLSKKCRRLLNFDRQIREHEVVNLASLFKKRISTFLGENISS